MARHILLAIDGSRPSLEACQNAVMLAWVLEARLTVLHVAVPRVPRNPMSRAEHREVESQAQTSGERLLREARMATGGVVPCATELHGGDPADVICQRARDLDVDLIVVGSRGLGALDRLLLGSVSSAVTQRAPCSVLVVRPRDTGAA